jgi:hypothetical protein
VPDAWLVVILFLLELLRNLLNLELFLMCVAIVETKWTDIRAIHKIMPIDGEIGCRDSIFLGS